MSYPMFSPEADRFFLAPNCRPSAGDLSVLYLVRRDALQCLGVDPDTRTHGQHAPVLFPGAMTIMAGIDLLAKFHAGTDQGAGGVGARFTGFLKAYLDERTEEECEAIYQLRNALLHSFGLYSKAKGQTYKFVLNNDWSGALIVRHPQAREFWGVSLGVLLQSFESSIERYQADLDSKPDLQTKFLDMVPNYAFMGQATYEQK
ncbi:hypothetical protein R5W23_000836 [Gemmata sp. JC673]|uniref:pEK499-p136 HEPN domain-containing protein n=1 Tax=Gemmata algarum TaxID=2975278 RepID=A0ABU5ESD4_9BACT|nr:hypothetical protein [Gemmata algarum]MDY3558115.1 hypothetical protein [Gemmata algarum]